MDGDDICYPDRLEKQISYLDRNPDCIAVGAQARHIDETGKLTGSTTNIAPPESCDPFSYPAKEPYIIHPFLMARRSALTEVGGYRYSHHSEDTDLYWRFCQKGRLHNLTDILGEYRLHGHSISGGSLKNGRLMAVFSQIAAISEQRRRAGRTDIVFEKNLIQQVKNLEKLQDIVEACTFHLGLNDQEQSYLEAASCAQLLQLVNYRPYDPELSDARYIRRCFKKMMPHMSQDNRKAIRRQLTGAAANLVLKGKLKIGLAALSVSDAPAFLYRLGLRLALPSGIRYKLRALSGNSAPAK